MHETPVTTHRAAPEQAEAIHALLAACGRHMTEHGLRNWDPPPATPASIRAEIVGEIVLVALDEGGALVGTATVRSTPTHGYEPDEMEGRIAWGTPAAPARYLNRLAVHPAWQGTGLGARLLAAAEAEARAAGAAALRFDVLAANEAVIRWYERRGCGVRGRRRHSGKDFVVMEKVL
jgi:ribosomal protein S18 acetylase RimI-like enzyme